MQLNTISKTAQRPDCPLSEGALRAMTKRGEVPGFYRGTRFYVHWEGLLSVLEEKSKLASAKAAVDQIK